MVATTAMPLVVAPAPSILSVQHRLLGRALHAVTPRIDWAKLLRRSMDVDALKCSGDASRDGRLRVLAVITEREPIERILSHPGMSTRPPPVPRARDPSDDVDDEAPAQLERALT